MYGFIDLNAYLFVFCLCIGLRVCTSNSASQSSSFPIETLKEALKPDKWNMEYIRDGAACQEAGKIPMYETTVPWDFPGEGRGIVDVRRFGPIALSGNEETHCFLTENIGPANSIWKGYWNRIVDAESLGTIHYPPVYIHHWVGSFLSKSNISLSGTNQTVATFGKRQKDNGVVCRSASGDSIDDSDIDSCSVVTFDHGIGKFMGDGDVDIGAVGYNLKKFHLENTRDFYRIMKLVDVRREGAPLMKIYVDAYNFYVTEPIVDFKPIAPIGLDANTKKYLDKRGEDSTAYVLPEDDHSVQMSSYKMEKSGQLHDFTVHLHGHTGDAIWLVRGVVAEALQVPREEAYDRYYRVKPACFSKPDCPHNALPLSVLLRDTDPAYKSLSEAGDGSDQAVAQLRAIKARFAAKLGPDLLCRFIAKPENFDESRIAAIEGSSGGGGSDSRNLSQEARTGWVPGSYFRHAVMEGPSCDMVDFEAGDVLSLLAFNVNRGEPFVQHTTLAGIIAPRNDHSSGNSSGGNSSSSAVSSRPETYQFCPH